MKKENLNKKSIVLTFITAITLVLAVVGASFAYFIAQTGSGASSNATVTTKTTDSLTFIGGSPIGITATQENFGTGKPNLSSETIAKARLIANTGNNTATYNYFVYLDITENDFEYTATTTPELILTITDSSGSEVKTIAGLTYVTSGSVTGFDVTTTKGLIKIAENKEITTTSTKEELWKVKLTFVNLTSDQQKNTGKTFVGQVKIQKEKIMTTIAEACVGQNMASCIKTNYNLEKLDNHTAALPNSAQDGSIRYSGANPNNYICFGPGATATGTACPEENQYRIIGVFGNQVKLIKKTTLGNKVWNSNNVNTWAGSTMETYLNGEYLNSLTTTWSNKIASNTWQVGGMSRINGEEATPSVAFNNEVGSKKANITFNGKIGLIYVSDYGFGASANFWTTLLFKYNPAKTNNWLSIANHEWSMSRNSDLSTHAFALNYAGYVDGHYTPTRNSYGVRPVFYLDNSVNITSGKGTVTDTYRVS